MSKPMKNHFLQLHLLTSYPPANLNRDDLGRPKTAVMGGALRLRVSSQSLKRAWRTSEVFESALSGHRGTRTKEMGLSIYKDLLGRGVSEKQAKEWAKPIAAVFGKSKNADENNSLQELEIQQLAHFSPEEREAVERLTAAVAERGSGPSEEELQLLRSDIRASDIALFGRMLADSPSHNVEAAAQVAHALAVHRCQVEEDFFTAVDDLNKGEEDMGAGHIGETEFGAAVFYLYLCIDRQLLLDNLQGDRELTNRTLCALVECAATVAPTGKQNSFASRAYASYILAEKGDRQPRSLSVAFLDPVSGSGMMAGAIEKMNEAVQGIDTVYGPCATVRAELNALSVDGSLEAIQQFAIKN